MDGDVSQLRSSTSRFVTDSGAHRPKPTEVGERFDHRYPAASRHIRDPPPHNAYLKDTQRDARRSESFPDDRRHSRWNGDSVADRPQNVYPPSNGHIERPRMVEGSLLPPRPETDLSDNRNPRLPRAHRPPPMSEPMRPDSVADVYAPPAFSRERDDDRYEQLSDRIERPQMGRRGASLLDRLSLNEQAENDIPPAPQSLRDRVQVPSKRDRDDMVDQDLSFEGDDQLDMTKRRKRSGKPRRGGRRGGAA